MANIIELKNKKTGVKQYPITKAQAVYGSDGNTVSQRLATDADDIESLKRQLDSFAHLAEGSVSTTGDAELDNARTTWYGIKEERAGNAIRNQAQNLILVQSGKPTGNALKGNKVWIKSSQDDIEIPEMSDIPSVDNTLTTEGAAADAKATGNTIAELKSALNYATGVNGISIAVKDKYLQTINNVIDVNNPRPSSSGYGYVIVPCSEGETFIVNGVSLATEPKAWVFTDSNYSVIAQDQGATTITDKKIIAPQNTAYLIIHDKAPYRQSYRGISVLTELDAIKSCYASGNIFGSLNNFNTTDSNECIQALNDGILNVVIPPSGISSSGNIIFVSKKIYKAGFYTIYFRPISTDAKNLFSSQNVRVAARNAITGSYSLIYVNTGIIDELGGYTLSFEAESASYITLYIFLNSSWNNKDLTYHIICQNTNEFNTANITSNTVSKTVQNNTAKRLVMYFSSSIGDDDNDGKSPLSPKKTISSYCAVGNVEIRLKSGDVFNENGLVLESNTTITTYGGTAKAILNGLRAATNGLTSDGNNIYSVVLPEIDIGYIKINGEANWHRCDTESEMASSGEWYFDTQNGTLYILSVYDLSNVVIEYSISEIGVYICKVKNCYLENIEIASFGKHGIAINSAQNITVKNCGVNNCGNSFLNNSRHGNGIQVWLEKVKDIFISNNTVESCFDAGITAQVNSSSATMNCENIYFEKNTIKDCFYPIEIFATQSTYSVTNIHFENNFILRCRDITDGHRGHANSNLFGQMMLWTLNGTPTESNRIYVRKNICIDSEKYAMVFYSTKIPGANDSGNQYIISDNVCIISQNDFINDETAYHGTDDVFLNIPVLPITADDFSKKAYYMSVAQERIT